MSLLILLACHFIGDFGFRPQVFEKKDISSSYGRMILILHCATYVTPFIIFAGISWIVALVLFVGHFLIDAFIIVKSKKYLNLEEPTSTYLDQGLHLGIIFLIYFLLFNL